MSKSAAATRPHQCQRNRFASREARNVLRDCEVERLRVEFFRQMPGGGYTAGDLVDATGQCFDRELAQHELRLLSEPFGGGHAAPFWDPLNPPRVKR